MPSGSLQWWWRMSHTTLTSVRRWSSSTSPSAKVRSSFSTTSRSRARSESSSKPRSKRSSAAGWPPAAPPTWRTTTASGSSPMASMSSLCSSMSRTAAAWTSGRSEFSTTYWPGWVLRRRSSARARSPRAASSSRHSATCPWNCGRSGCVAYGARAGDIRYIRMSRRSRKSKIPWTASMDRRRCGFDCQRRGAWVGSSSPRTLTAKPSFTQRLRVWRRRRSLRLDGPSRPGLPVAARGVVVLLLDLAGVLGRPDGVGRLADVRVARGLDRVVDLALGVRHAGVTHLGVLLELRLGLLLALGHALAGLGERALGLRDRLVDLRARVFRHGAADRGGLGGRGLLLGGLVDRLGRAVELGLVDGADAFGERVGRRGVDGGLCGLAVVGLDRELLHRVVVRRVRRHHGVRRRHRRGGVGGGARGGGGWRRPRPAGGRRVGGGRGPAPG